MIETGCILFGAKIDSIIRKEFCRGNFARIFGVRGMKERIQ
tara:strand:+ start:113 stop:235 length:123 start_codon:yes stop_codon:yes gene_type:complete